MEIIAFEYSREQNSLHYNYFKNGDSLEYDINSNGYRILAFVDEDLTMTEEWVQLCQNIYRVRPDYRTAVYMTMAAIRHITLKTNK